MITACQLDCDSIVIHIGDDFIRKLNKHNLKYAVLFRHNDKINGVHLDCLKKEKLLFCDREYCSTNYHKSIHVVPNAKIIKSGDYQCKRHLLSSFNESFVCVMNLKINNNHYMGWNYCNNVTKVSDRALLQCDLCNKIILV